MQPNIKRVKGSTYEYAEHITREDAKMYYNKGYTIGLSSIVTGETYVIQNNGCSFDYVIKFFKKTISNHVLNYYRLS